MGAGLSTPIRNKGIEKRGSKYYKAGVTSMQGYRNEMEDTHMMHTTTPNPVTPDKENMAVFGVFDGHAGSYTAKWAARHLGQKILELANSKLELKPIVEESFKTSLTDTVLQFDKDLQERETSQHHLGAFGGCTCIFSLVWPVPPGSSAVPEEGSAESKKTKRRSFGISKLADSKSIPLALIDQQPAEFLVLVGNIGDSRCILGRKNGQFQSLSTDHKPWNSLERNRIMLAGGVVEYNRVDGCLALSRALGDFHYKLNTSRPQTAQKVISVPDYTMCKCSPGDFLVLACDGIFDVMTNKQVVSFVHAQLTAQQKKRRSDPAAVASLLIDRCLTLGSRDNMTAMVVVFENGEDYNTQGEEFVPGPVPRNASREFLRAYTVNCKNYNYTVEEAREKFKETQQTNNKSKVRRVSELISKKFKRGAKKKSAAALEANSTESKTETEPEVVGGVPDEVLDDPDEELVNDTLAEKGDHAAIATSLDPLGQNSNDPIDDRSISLGPDGDGDGDVRDGETERVRPAGLTAGLRKERRSVVLPPGMKAPEKAEFVDDTKKDTKKGLG